MEGNVYRKCFFAGTRETQRQINEIRRDYNYVNEQGYDLYSPSHGEFSISVLWYASPRPEEDPDEETEE